MSGSLKVSAGAWEQNEHGSPGPPRGEEPARRWKNRLLFQWAISLQELTSPFLWLTSQITGADVGGAAGRALPHCMSPLPHASLPACPGSPTFTVGNFSGSRRVVTYQLSAVGLGTACEHAFNPRPDPVTL